MHIPTLTRLAVLAGAASIAAGCSEGGDATNAADANALDVNAMLAEPGNDASALEAAVNASEPVFTGNESAGNSAETNKSGR